MISIKRWLGLDFLDLLIHGSVTVCLLLFVGMTGGPEELYPVMVAGSLLLFGLRRRWALRRGAADQGPSSDRLAEVEDRVNYLETLQDRLMELEERLDFAERLLTKQQNERLPG